MHTKLAVIALIIEISDISNTDEMQIVKLKNLERTVVVKKNEFRVGDLCIYVQTDNILSSNIFSDFLRGDRLSQGLILPLSILPDFERENNGMLTCNDGTGARLYINEGIDVTDTLIKINTKIK